MTTRLEYPFAPGAQRAETSREAARRLGGLAETVRSRALREIYRAGDHGATSEELAIALALPRATVQPRTTELRRVGKIHDSGERRINASSGLRAIVWRFGPAPAASIDDTPLFSGEGLRDAA